MSLYCSDNSEHGQIGYYIYCDVIYQRSCSLGAACHHSQHDVAGLRDTAVGHETLHVVLKDSEDICQCYCGYYHAEHQFPAVGHLCEHFSQDAHQREGCGSFRDDGQIACHGCRRALVCVRRPHVEWDKTQLEA